MSRGFSRSSRAKHADQVLRAKDPREEGRALAQELGVNFGALWEWVLQEAEARARSFLDPFPSLRELSDAATRRRYLKFLKADRTLVARHVAGKELRRCPASPDDLRDLFASLPRNRAQDWAFHELVSRPEMPVDLLHDLVRQRRFDGEIGHRAGPREVLEEFLTLHPDYSETVLTLLHYHYSKEDVPASHFERFLREHWDMDIVRKWAREDHDFPADKREVLKKVVADSPPPTSPAWLYPPPESGEEQG